MDVYPDGAVIWKQNQIVEFEGKPLTTINQGVIPPISIEGGDVKIGWYSDQMNGYKQGAYVSKVKVDVSDYSTLNMLVTRAETVNTSLGGQGISDYTSPSIGIGNSNSGSGDMITSQPFNQSQNIGTNVITNQVISLPISHNGDAYLIVKVADYSIVQSSTVRSETRCNVQIAQMWLE